MQLLDKVGLARRLGVSPETVTKWAREERIPEIRISAKVRRFDYEEVVSALKQRSRAGNKEQRSDQLDLFTSLGGHYER